MSISGSKGSGYYRFFYNPLYHISALYLKLKYKYRYDTVTLGEEGTLVVANHTAGPDPLFAGICIKEPLTFVLSDHLIRNRVLGTLINALMANIVRVKARTESRTAYSIIKALKEGRKVMLFPEGSETYSGKTGHIMPGIGRLLKLSGAGLVTLRLERTFALSPRWHKGLSKGDAHGRVMHIYTGADLKNMSAEEIDRIVKDDISYDFYEDEKTPFKSRNRAEYLETAVFVCPNCGGISTLKSRGTRFFCRCGLDLCLNEYMRFESLTDDPAPFDNIRELFEWQDGRIPSICEDFASFGTNAPITSDGGVSFASFTVDPPKTQKIAKGRLTLYPDRLELAEKDGTLHSIMLKDIRDITTVQRNDLYLRVSGDKYYEFKRKGDFSPLKYALLASGLSSMRSMVY